MSGISRRRMIRPWRVGLCDCGVRSARTKQKLLPKRLLPCVISRPFILLEQLTHQLLLTLPPADARITQCMALYARITLLQLPRAEKYLTSGVLAIMACIPTRPARSFRLNGSLAAEGHMYACHLKHIQQRLLDSFSATAVHSSSTTGTVQASRKHCKAGCYFSATAVARAPRTPKVRSPSGCKLESIAMISYRECILINRCTCTCLPR